MPCTGNEQLCREDAKLGKILCQNQKSSVRGNRDVDTPSLTHGLYVPFHLESRVFVDFWGMSGKMSASSPFINQEFLKNSKQDVDGRG
jgi:hypothetical protein